MQLTTREFPLRPARYLPIFFLILTTFNGSVASAGPAAATATATAISTEDAVSQPLDVPSSIDALEPAGSGGITAVDRSLARLSTHKRLLMIAAHPDDEDTFVLAHVSRALGGEAAYLSLSRGDGGQNLIGTELGEGLGLLRSRELESARQVDGARQYFTRAFDFGYTRSLDETLRRWPEQELMEDARAVAKRFKPQVIVSVFPADARAGHGQHQASAVVAERLYAELAADPESPIKVSGFFRSSWWNPSAANVKLDLGIVDPLTGRSTFQTALASRSRHRCQDMGFEQPPGDAEASLIREGNADSDVPGTDLFADVDTRLAAIAAPLAGPAHLSTLHQEAEDVLTRVESTARRLRENLVPSRLHETAPPLAELVESLQGLRRQLVTAREATESADDQGRLTFVLELLDEKIQIAREGLGAAAGIVADAITDRRFLVPGEPFTVKTLFWSASGVPVDHISVEILADDGLELVSQAPTEPADGRFRATVDDAQDLVVAVHGEDGADRDAPYFLQSSRDGDLYQDGGDGVRGLPFQAPPLRVRFHGRLFGVDMEWTREVVQRYRDQAIGEVRRPLSRVRPLEVSLDRGSAVRATGDPEPLRLQIVLTRFSAEPLAGSLIVDVPDGWPTPEAVPFRVDGPAGSQVTLNVHVPVPADLGPGRFEILVQTLMDGDATPRIGHSTQWIDYEHVRPTALPRQARFVLQTGDLKLPALRRVGYVRGASDRVPEQLMAIGLPVELLDAEQLAARDLSDFDVVVIGSRAFEVEPRLAQANDRLLDFARAGGTVLVQYQQYQYVRGGFAPFPLDIHRPHDRVTDEEAAVRILDPEHELLNRPHRIGEPDWQGWVQERGLYFGGTWDAAWTPLLAMRDPIGDPGGDEKQGALLVAELGEGRYIYTGLAFFRQLPAGVVGAYRLFLNLLTPSAAGASEESP